MDPDAQRLGGGKLSAIEIDEYREHADHDAGNQVVRRGEREPRRREQRDPELQPAVIDGAKLAREPC